MLFRRMARRRVAFFILFILCLGLGRSATAHTQGAATPQSATGTISGIATDETGATLSDVRIT